MHIYELAATPTERPYNNKLTGQNLNSPPHITVHLQANTQSQACKRAAILPTHPSPPTTQTETKFSDKKLTKNFGNRKLTVIFAKY
jgi:hypothetical protein